MTAPVTYAVEAWGDCWREMQALWGKHWEEIAIHRDAIPLDPDIQQYQHLQDTGNLCVVVARSAGVIIGYYISIIRTHLHYRTTLHAFTDVYYIHPDFRKGRTGIRLVQEAMTVWKQRGVKKALTATKEHLDMGPVFDYLGWAKTETVFTTLLTE